MEAREPFGPRDGATNRYASTGLNPSSRSHRIVVSPSARRFIFKEPTKVVSRWLHDPSFWIIVVSLSFGVAQLALMDIDRYLAWDEAVYLSEVNPRVDAVGMYAHRARGITLVAAPVALISDSVVLLRGYLIVISSIGLWGAFQPWCRTIAWAAPVSAALFGSSWLALAYGSELLPNYFSALLAVATIGLAVNYHNRHSARLLVSGLFAVGLATLVRPLDGVVLVVAIILLNVVYRDSRSRHFLAASTVGAVFGGLPWVIEAWLRFGGPIERLELTRDVVGGGVTNNIGNYLNMLAGPIGSGDLAVTPQLSALWLAILLSFAAAGLILSKQHTRRAGLITLTTSALLAAPYVFYSQASTPRFMIPALALLSLSAGIGAVRVVQRDGSSAWTFASGLAIVGVVVFNVAVIGDWAQFQADARRASPVLGQVLASDSQGEPCYFLSTYGFPQISVASGCDGGRLTEDPNQNLQLLDRARAEGKTAYALVASNDPSGLLDSGWHCDLVSSLPDGRWHLCVPNG